METISIIIPTKNRSILLQECLDSILSQQVDDFIVEMIVMDDSSSEDVFNRTIVPTLKKSDQSKFILNYYKSDRSVGPAPLRNVGIDVAKGQYIMFLDDDDVLDTTRSLSKLYKVIKGKTKSLVYGKSYLYECKDDKWEFKFVYYMLPFSVALLIDNGGQIPLGSFLVTNDGLPKFRDDLRLGEDYEWQLRLTREYTFIPTNIDVHRYLRRDCGHWASEFRSEESRLEYEAVVEETIKSIRRDDK